MVFNYVILFSSLFPLNVHHSDKLIILPYLIFVFILTCLMLITYVALLGNYYFSLVFCISKNAALLLYLFII